MKLNILTMIVLVTVLGLVACDSRVATTSVVPTPVSIIPTATPLPTATATAAPTATETPAQISTETPAAPTATLCPTPTPSRPVGQIVFSAVPCAEAGVNCELTESSVGSFYVINSDGTGLRQLIARGGTGLSLSPDGKKIAFMAALEDVEYSPMRSHLYVWTISTGEVQPLMADLPDESSPQPPQWFPDSNWLAYVSNVVDDMGTMLRGSQTDLYLIRTDGTGRRKVIERPPNSHIQSVAISPDGSQIAFVGLEWDSGLPQKVAAYCVNADGSNLRELMVFPPPAYFAELFWSPDGSKVFTFDPTVEYPAIVYVIQPNHAPVPAEQIDLLHIPGHFTRWRWTSGSEIEIATCERSIGTSIWTVNANDLSLRKRTSIPSEQCVGIPTGGWSPDGTRIVFSEHAGPPESFGLYTLDINSGCRWQILGGYYVLDLLWLPAEVVVP